MFVLIQVLAIVLVVVSHEHEAITASVIIQVNKHTDAAKPFYSAHAYLNDYWGSQQSRVPFPLPQKEQNFLIDLDAPFIWHYCLPLREGCDACPRPVTCRESPCTDLRTNFSYQSPSCPKLTNDSIFGGYYNHELCPVNVINPVTGSCSQVIPTYDVIMFRYTNGDRNVLTDMYATNPTAACAPPWMFYPFPANVVGVMALSSSPYALPAFLHHSVERTMGLCLPSSSSASGALFFGSGPYYLSPQSNLNVRSFLTYTALIKQPNSFGYFIGVNAIVIENISINVPVNSTTKISTLAPYTELRTEIYNNVVSTFSKVTRQIPPAALVAPFGVCYSTLVNGTKVDISVPDIDLVLKDGKKWTISTANSVKQVTEDVACLAFVESGPTSEHAIVIGTYQIEDNFLLFNLENSTLGFSSSLLRTQSSCSNFGSNIWTFASKSTV